MQGRSARSSLAAVPKKYTVTLAEEQREQLRKLTRSGKAPAREIAHARVLLKADVGNSGGPLPDDEIARVLELSASTVGRVRKRFSSEGLEAALKHRTPRAFKPRRLDGRAEAHLIALACSDPPLGRSQWSLRLLADRLVELGHVESVSHETVGQVLKKTRSRRT